MPFFLNAKKTFLFLTKLIFTLAGIVHNKSSVAETSVLSPGSSIILICSIAYMVGSKTGLYQRHLVAFLTYFGICAAKITNRLIIAAMTRSEIRVTDPALWTLCLIGLNQYWNFILDEDYLFFSVFIYSIIDILRFLNRTYNQIAEFLHLKVLFV